MSRASAEVDTGRPRGETAVLLAAGILVVAALLFATVAGMHPLLSVGNSGPILLISIAIGAAALAAAMLHRAMQRYAKSDQGMAAEIAELRKSLLAAEAVIKAEPQVLVFWEQGQAVRIMMHTLGGVAGLPAEPKPLLAFGKWLDPASAQQLKKGLDILFAEGQSFTLLLKTVRGGYVEADGRAGGGRAILRLRAVAGRKQDLAKILDQHRQLVRDTIAGRTLLNALPMPAWFRSADGRLEWVNEATSRRSTPAVAPKSASARSSCSRPANATRSRPPSTRAPPTAIGYISSARARARPTMSSFCRWMAPQLAPPST